MILLVFMVCLHRKRYQTVISDFSLHNAIPCSIQSEKKNNGFFFTSIGTRFTWKHLTEYGASVISQQCSILDCLLTKPFDFVVRFTIYKLRFLHVSLYGGHTVVFLETSHFIPSVYVDSIVCF